MDATALRYFSTVEYPALGFLQNGGTVDDNVLLTPYIPGKTFKDHLVQGGDTNVIDSVLTTVNNAHSKEIIYGDRHPRNIILQPDGTVVHIDFDYELGGRHAKELEMALLLYPMLGYTTQFDEATARISQFVARSSDHYDWQTVVDFMKRYQQYLTKHLIGKDRKQLIPRLGSKLDIATTSMLGAAV